jgi:hypothetical protein
MFAFRTPFARSWQKSPTTGVVQNSTFFANNIRNILLIPQMLSRRAVTPGPGKTDRKWTSMFKNEQRFPACDRIQTPSDVVDVK